MNSFRCPRRRIAGAVGALTLGIGCLVFSMHEVVRAEDDADKKTKQDVIRNAKDTTVITGPVDAAGYVDYVQAVNERHSKGVTPENNFEVVVRSVLPPDEISEDMRDEYFSRIGMPTPKEDARFYTDYITFVLKGSTDRKERDQAFDEHAIITNSPWAAQDHPAAADWVAEYGKDLDRLCQGSLRSRFYAPYLAGDVFAAQPAPRMISILLPSVQQQREIARGLTIRAMGRIHTGDLDGAWNDIQAMHRIARHIGSGFTLIEGLVAIAIDNIALQAEIHVLNSPALTKDRAARFLNDLKQLQPIQPMADKMDYGERFMGLDTVVTLARNADQHGLFKILRMIGDLSDVSKPDSPYVLVAARKDEKDIKATGRLAIDWNATLLLMNGWYDRLVKSAREPDFKRRRALFESIETDIKAMAAETRDTQKMLQNMSLKGTPKAVGEAIGKVLIALLLPAVDAARGAEDMATARADVIRLAFAVRNYTLDEKSLPKSPADLTPQYLKAIPQDTCSGDALKYIVNDDEIRIYSVGRNGVDDNGRTPEDTRRDGIPSTEWDDIVVRVSRM